MDNTSDVMYKARKELMKDVRELRHQLELSQTEFGRLLGKSLPTIQRWETLRPPNPKELPALEALAKDKAAVAESPKKRAALEDLASKFGASFQQGLTVREHTASWSAQWNKDRTKMSGYLLVSIDAAEEAEYTYGFFDLMMKLRSEDPKNRAAAMRKLADIKISDSDLPDWARRKK